MLTIYPRRLVGIVNLAVSSPRVLHSVAFVFIWVLCPSVDAVSANEVTQRWDPKDW